MLGWVLLQIHNHHIIDRFFEAIREAISKDSFIEQMQRFEETYESQSPGGTGNGPRVRGYQYKSEGPGEAKKNKSPFTSLANGVERMLGNAPLTNVAGDETPNKQDIDSGWG